MSVFMDFLTAALVMAAWVGVAFVLAFVAVFVMDLIGERIYGRQANKERGRGCSRR
jgi:uncharacterized membrane protein (DUF485 family)